MSDNLTAVLIVGMSVIGPIWVTLHYVYKFKMGRQMNGRDVAAFEALSDTAARMEARMAMLEQILDDQAPGWRADDRVSPAPYQRARP
jgi:phage shock protein B